MCSNENFLIRKKSLFPFLIKETRLDEKEETVPKMESRVRFKLGHGIKSGATAAAGSRRCTSPMHSLEEHCSRHHSIAFIERTMPSRLTHSDVPTSRSGRPVSRNNNYTMDLRRTWNIRCRGAPESKVLSLLESLARRAKNSMEFVFAKWQYSTILDLRFICNVHM